VEVELLDGAVDTDGRGAEEFVEEEEVVRWCGWGDGRLFVEEPLPVRGRGFSEVVGTLGRDGA
jgi:hypothetical protein